MQPSNPFSTNTDMIVSIHSLKASNGPPIPVVRKGAGTFGHFANLVFIPYLFFWYPYLISFWRTTLLYMLSLWASKWNWRVYYINPWPEQSEHSFPLTNIIGSGDSVRDWDFIGTSLRENLILSHWTWACEPLWAILPSQSIMDRDRESLQPLDMPVASLPLHLSFMVAIPFPFYQALLRWVFKHLQKISYLILIQTSFSKAH